MLLKIFTCAIVVALFFLILFPYSSVAQKKSTIKPSISGAQQLSRLFSLSVQHFADSALNTAQLHSDSLKSIATLTAIRVTSRLDALADSLITSARDSLDVTRKDTLRFVTTSFRRQVMAYGDTSKRAVGASFDYFLNELTKGKKAYLVCDSCESVRDFIDRLDEFRDFVDNLHESYHDTTSSLMDDQRDTFQDRYENARDSLGDLRDHLIDNRLDEIDYQRYFATRFDVSTDYSNHMNYRGRDNGVSQQLLAPSLSFHHSSGLGIALSAALVDQSSNQLDNIALTASYEFFLGSIFVVDLSYNHFWFSDSSKSEKSVFNNAVDASLTLNLPVLTLGLDGNLAMGSASEFTVAASASHSFEIPLTLYDKISIEPALTAVIGEQNSALTTLRAIKGPKGKKVIGTQTLTQTNNMFGILDYEVSIPVTIEWGRVTMAPQLTYIALVNVVDLSTRDPFVSFDLTVSVAIR